MRFFKFSESGAANSGSSQSERWADRDTDIDFEDIDSCYDHAYRYAKKRQFHRAASCLMQIDAKEHYFAGSPAISFEQLYTITQANPACASRLLCDRRNLLLINNLTYLLRYLSVAEHMVEYLFNWEFISQLITSHESLGEVLKVVPDSYYFLLKTKRLASLIQFESNLLDVAKCIPNNMGDVLNDPRLLGLIHSPAILSSLIIITPSLITLLGIPRLNKLLAGGSFQTLLATLKDKAVNNEIEAQKALGLAYLQGLGDLSIDEHQALRYFEMAVKEDSFCANKVGEVRQRHITKHLAEKTWDFFELQELVEKIPMESHYYLDALLLIGNKFFVANIEEISGLSLQETDDKTHLRLALIFFIKAYELKKNDSFITTLIDQTLNILYLDNKILEGSLDEKYRQKLIDNFKEKWETSLSMMSNIPTSMKSGL